jgi:hypothetical protein|tara:strand:- start:246 stop:686 length:441 start_codon:yes stop_codon:yes gene_type:complete
MKYFYQLLLFAGIFIWGTSCVTKDGCTDCNATNYDINADIDNNSCQYVNENHLGAYAVSDSIMGPPDLEWYYRNYNVDISRSDCAPNNLIITNYSNNNNTFSEILFSVECEAENDSITIYEQEVNGNTVRNSFEPGFSLFVARLLI